MIPAAYNSLTRVPWSNSPSELNSEISSWFRVLRHIEAGLTVA